MTLSHDWRYKGPFRSASLTENLLKKEHTAPTCTGNAQKIMMVTKRKCLLTTVLCIHIKDAYLIPRGGHHKLCKANVELNTCCSKICYPCMRSLKKRHSWIAMTLIAGHPHKVNRYVCVEWTVSANFWHNV